MLNGFILLSKRMAKKTLISELLINMKTFLVKGIVYLTPYMGKERSFEDIRLVVAESATDAEEKFERWWENKTNEYSVYYHAHGEALETIE